MWRVVEHGINTLIKLLKALIDLCFADQKVKGEEQFNDIQHKHMADPHRIQSAGRCICGHVKCK